MKRVPVIDLLSSRHPEATPESLELLVGGAGTLQMKRAPERTRLIRNFEELHMGE